MTTFPIYVICPHCDSSIQIDELNCCIFRHGVFKNTMKQIDAHSPEQLCKEYIYHNVIYGCGKPFKIIQKDSNFFAEICEYI